MGGAKFFPHTSRQGRNRDRECPRYDVMEGGTRLGCVLENVTVLPSYVTVTVTGSAGGGTEVPCSDSSVDLQLVGGRGRGAVMVGRVLPKRAILPVTLYFLISCPTFSFTS